MLNSTLTVEPSTTINYNYQRGSITDETIGRFFRAAGQLSLV